MLRIRTSHFAREPSSLSRIIIWKGLLYVGALASSFLLLLWQAPPSFSQSIPSIVINEIMYDLEGSDSGREWIEVYNSGLESVDLAGWRFEEGGAQHLLNPVQGGMVIPSEGFALIVDNPDLFLHDHPGFSGILVDSSFSLSNDGEVLILRSGKDVEPPVDAVSYLSGWGGNGNGKSVALNSDGIWKEANPTPGAENSFPEEGTKDQQEEQPQPTVTFSSPSTISVDTAFSVSTTLKNFKSGTYFLKVLIGKGDKFYDGRTKGVNGEWLAWNAGWADFPKTTVGSSGSGSGTIQAKTDGDVVAGSYLIKVRAYDGKDTFDSDTKPLTVTGSAKVEGTLRAPGSEELGSESAEEILGEVTGGDGEVKGEEAPQGEGFKLNFYIILGIFGLLVGSGGLILAFRRGARRSQTPDTPEQESTPLSERSCTPNG